MLPLPSHPCLIAILAPPLLSRRFPLIFWSMSDRMWRLLLAII